MVIFLLLIVVYIPRYVISFSTGETVIRLHDEHSSYFITEFSGSPILTVLFFSPEHMDTGPSEPTLHFYKVNLRELNG